MTTPSTVWSRFRRTRFRLLYLLAVTGGAIATTLYLIAPHSEHWSPLTCWLIFAAAWVSAIAAWRRHRPHLRHWSGVYTFGLVFVEFILVVALLIQTSDLWTFKNVPHKFVNVRHKIVSAPAVNPQDLLESRRLYAAIERNDLAVVKLILQTTHRIAPVQVTFSSPHDAYIIPDIESIFQSTDGAPAVKGMSAIAPRPLDWAVEQGRLQIAAVLFDSGAVVSDNEHHPLIVAAQRNDIPMMRLLIHHGATVNDFGDESDPLWSAVAAGKSEAVKFLLGQGANPNTHGLYDGNYQIDSHNLTVLQFAQSQKNRAIVNLLLHAGAKR